MAKAKAKTEAKAEPKPRKAKAPKAEKPKKLAAKAKSISKADDYRGKSADELNEQLAKLKKEQFNLRFQRANGQLENTGRIRTVRKSIARIQTVLTADRRKAAAQG